MTEDNVAAGKLQEKIPEKNIFLASLKSLKKGAGSGSFSQRICTKMSWVPNRTNR
jgi:hypothetical protein